jgi:hypothetical protein
MVLKQKIFLGVGGYNIVILQTPKTYVINKYLYITYFDAIKMTKFNLK